MACLFPKSLLKVPCTVWFFFMLPQAARAPGKDLASLVLPCPGLHSARCPPGLYRPMSAAVLPARAPGTARYLDR